MTCEALGIEYKYVLCDLQEGDNFKPEYLKINPQHTVPTLNDNGFIVTESRPIATYLCDKYGQDDKLYPKDLKLRATVDSRLFFDIGTFYKAFGDCVVSVISIARGIQKPRGQ